MLGARVEIKTGFLGMQAMNHTGPRVQKGSMLGIMFPCQRLRLLKQVALEMIHSVLVVIVNMVGEKAHF